jgi:hypothetical protein
LSPLPSSPSFLFPLSTNKTESQAITGAITSNFLSNLPTTKVKETSIYAPGKEKIEALMDGRSVKENHTSADTYAETVVKNVMRRNPKKRIWEGGVVGAIWFVTTFLWATAWDWILRKQSGIWELKKGLKGKLR